MNDSVYPKREAAIVNSHKGAEIRLDTSNFDSPKRNFANDTEIKFSEHLEQKRSVILQ
jgi:hypothetical protein